MSSKTIKALSPAAMTQRLHISSSFLMENTIILLYQVCDVDNNIDTS